MQRLATGGGQQDSVPVPAARHTPQLIVTLWTALANCMTSQSSTKLMVNMHNGSKQQCLKTTQHCNDAIALPLNEEERTAPAA